MATSRRHRGGSSCGVVIDVGSGSVGAGVVISREGKKLPEIVYAHRETMRIGEKPTVDDRIRAMRHALFAATLKVSKEGLQKLRGHGRGLSVDRILVVCSAPWSQTLTQIIHFEQDEPFTVTRERVQQLVENAKEQRPDHHEESDILKDLGMHIVEKSIVDVTLNGYPVDSPYDRQAKEIHVAHLTGLVPNEILDAIRDIEKNVLVDTTTSVHTYALILYCVLRDLYPHNKDALIVDVTGEATEISVMRDHVLLEAKSTDYGAHTLLRFLASRIKTVPEEARAHVRSYGTDATDEKMNVYLEEAAEALKTELQELLEDLSARYVLPQHMFLSIDSDIQPLFAHALQKARKEASAAGEYTIIPVDKAVSGKLAAFDPKMPPDQFLAVAARFFHKLHACGEIKE